MTSLSCAQRKFYFDRRESNKNLHAYAGKSRNIITFPYLHWHALLTILSFRRVSWITTSWIMTFYYYRIRQCIYLIQMKFIVMFSIIFLQEHKAQMLFFNSFG